jgi:toxin ParE1/3/4
MARIRLARTAQTDLEDIWHYTVSTWGREQAERYIALIEKAFHRLLENPYSGKARPDVHKGYRALPVEKHVIFYTVSTDSIDVLGIPHERMDARRHLAGEEPPPGPEGIPVG